MTDLIIIAVLLVIIGLAVNYIVKAKKSGVKCIGCPSEGACSRKSNEACNCGCGSHTETNE